jgi:glycosyltransferase involved in cell wall biosynthesis
MNGLLCKVRSADSLANAMRDLIRMSLEERTNMGAASRRLIEERFSEERVVHAYVDALEAFARPD